MVSVLLYTVLLMLCLLLWIAGSSSASVFCKVRCLIGFQLTFILHCILALRVHVANRWQKYLFVLSFTVCYSDF